MGLIAVVYILLSQRCDNIARAAKTQMSIAAQDALILLNASFNAPFF